MKKKEEKMKRCILNLLLSFVYEKGELNLVEGSIRNLVYIRDLNTTRALSSLKKSQLRTWGHDCLDHHTL